MINEDEEIDYLHPDGKPVSESKSTDGTIFDERELEAASKREKNALVDADGHHMCSAECQHKHKTKI